MEQLIERIIQAKKQENALILAHFYQAPEVQDLADRVGDSLELARYAATTDVETIVLAGVRFMAESAKLLSPDKRVLLPVADAGCPMADMLDVASLKSLKKAHPQAVVVTYVNSSAAVKAESDVCCTSSNAVKIVESFPPDQEIIFVPDRNLGSYVAEKSGRELILHSGYCPTHQRLLPEFLVELRARYPRALIMAHPECVSETRQLADFVGSTAQIIEECRLSPEKEFIIATENGVLHPLAKVRPDAKFYPASERHGICPNMKKTSLESILTALEDDRLGLVIPEELARRARLPLEKMLRLS